MSASCEHKKPKKMNIVACLGPAPVSMNVPPTHPEAQHAVTPTTTVLSADAAVQCVLGEADDMLIGCSQAVEAPTMTSSSGSYPQGSPLMVEIRESSVNWADHH